MTRRLSAVSVTALCVVIVEAVGLSGQSQGVPRFRSGVQLIEVDVRVTDSNGRFVRGLTKDDFTLLDDGVRQTVTSATFVDLAIESPVPSRRTPPSAEPDVVNNAGTGRTWVMLLGGSGDRVGPVARRFVQEALGPNDQVAVISVHGTMSNAQGFTRSRELLLAAIDRSRHVEPVLDPVRIAYEVLQEVSERLGLMSGGRKAVVYFDPPPFFSINQQDPLSVGKFFYQRDALRAATRNNVAIYVVSTEGLTTELSSPLSLAPASGGRTNDPLLAMAGQRVLAEVTGGDAIVNSNNFEDGFKRFVEDSSQYYLLGYTPTVERRDGQFHTLTVRVNRPGVTVRARRGYYAPSADQPEPNARPVRQPDGLSLSPDTREALRWPLSMNGLTVDLAVAPFRGADGNGAVLLTAQVRGQDLVLESGELVEVGYQAMTTEGMLTPGAFHVFKLDLSSQSRTSAESAGLRFVDWLALPPGRHQVRFAVHQPNGKTGMVVGDMDVPNFAASPLSMSGMVFASERLREQQTMKADEPLRKLLGVSPTAERSFVQGDVLTTYVEVYTNAKTPPPPVIARLARADQLNRAQPVNARPVVAEPGRAGWVTRIPIETLEPGIYVLSLEARAGRRSALRQVPFTVTPG